MNERLRLEPWCRALPDKVTCPPCPPPGAGLPLLSDIPDVLMRFRYHRVAVSADIKKAFLMVGLAEPDRDVLCFL